MSAEDNKAVLRRAIEEIWNRHSTEAIPDLVAESYAMHFGAHSGGIAGYRQWHADLHTACPDLHLDINDMVAEGDLVVTHWTFQGTNTGENVLPDQTHVPATGRRVTISGVNITRVANGKLVEDWQYFDTADWLGQLGILPAPAQSQQVGA